MYISNLKLWNFRKFGSEEEFDLQVPNLDLDLKEGMNVLIGENDSGKTAIIDAIKLILKTHSVDWIRLEENDFYKDSERLRIECRFEKLSIEEAKNFTEWLGIDDTGAEIKAYLRVILDATKSKGEVLSFDVRAGVDDSGYPLTLEAKEYLKAVYLKPLRNAQGELIPRKNSRLSQILYGHEAFKGKSDSHYLVDIFKDLNENIELYFQAQKKDGGSIVSLTTDIKGKDLKDEIDRHLNSFCDLTSILRASGGDLKSILEALLLSLEDTKSGLGTYNRLFIAAELLHLNKRDWDGVRLGLIEELEAHLHPQAQLRVVEYLNGQENVQLILTTHSPNIGSKVKLDNLIICHNDKVFPMSKGCTKLEDSDYEFLEKFLDVTKSNLFFARGLIFVEGWSEMILIPILAQKVGINLTEKGISIINVSGTSFLRYAKIFQRSRDPQMNIPVSVITDLDVKPNEENYPVEGETKKEKATREKKAQYNGGSVETFVSEQWTFEYCLYKSPFLGGIFEGDVREIHSGTDFTDFEGVLSRKLADRSLSKTEIAYRMAKRLLDDPNLTLNQTDPSIGYILRAIQYAIGD